MKIELTMNEVTALMERQANKDKDWQFKLDAIQSNHTFATERANRLDRELSELKVKYNDLQEKEAELQGKLDAMTIKLERTKEKVLTDKEIVEELVRRVSMPGAIALLGGVFHAVEGKPGDETATYLFRNVG